MKKNKNLILENIKLTSAGAKGVSVGKTEDGKTVLVSGAIPGDTVNARVKKAGNFRAFSVSDRARVHPFRRVRRM